MDFDLEFWLVSATAVTGVIWLLYALLAGKKAEGTEPVLVEYARSFFPVLLAVLLLRSFVAEPFRIPSGSMLPTLEIGDFILVNKFAYGLRLPVLHTKVLDVGDPQRGDVVVFRFPGNPKIDYIKRLIGLPGDVVSWNDKTLTVNGIALNRDAIGEYLRPDQQTPPSLRLKEDLLGVPHDILVTPGRVGPTGSVTVPPGHYFMMGDNRDNSNDGRMWGLVPDGNVVGKATIVWMHMNLGGDGFNLSRIGNAMH